MTTNPYTQGMAAAQACEPEKTNPHRKGTTAWQQWRLGYRYARQQKAEQQQREAQTRARAWMQ